MKRIAISILLLIVFTFTGCTFGGKEYGFSKDLFNDDGKSTIIDGGGGSNGGGSGTVIEEPEKPDNIDLDEIYEKLSSKFSYDILDKDGNVTETVALDLFAGALLTFKLDYSKQNNTETNQQLIKQSVEELSSEILDRLVGRYGIDIANGQSDVFLGKLITEDYLNNYNQILFKNYNNTLEFLNAISNTNIMEIPVLTGVYSDYINNIILSTNGESIVSEDLFVALKDLRVNNENYNLEVSTYDDNSKYTYSNIDEQNILIKANIKIKSAFDSPKSIKIYTMPNNSEPIYNTTINPGAEFDVEISNSNGVAGIYRIVCENEVYYLYLDHSLSQFEILSSPTLFKDTHFDAIRNSWGVEDGDSNISNHSWNWTLENYDSDFSQEYVEKYEKALNIAILKILMFGYQDSTNSYLGAIPTKPILVGTRNYSSVRDLYTNAMAYAIDGTLENKVAYDDFIDFSIKKIDHVGFTNFELDEVSEFILNFVIGQQIVILDTFTDHNNNKTFDNNEVVNGNQDFVVVDYSNESLRFDEKSDEWKTINFVDNGTSVEITNWDTRSDYFKNYTNIVYSILYNCEAESPQAIYYQKMIGDLTDISSIFNGDEEDNEEDENPVDEEEGNYADSLNMETAGVLQSFVLIPNPAFFSSRYSTSIIHLLSFALQNPNEIDLSDYLNCNVIYKKGEKNTIYSISGILEDSAWLTIDAFSEPLNNDDLLTGQNVEGLSVPEYGFSFNEENVANVIYFSGFEEGNVEVSTFNGTEYTTASDIATNVASNAEGVSFTFNEKSFYYDKSTGYLTTENYISSQKENGYFSYLNTACDFDNFDSDRGQVYLSATFDYVEILFNLNRDYGKLFEELIVIALYACK